MPEIDSWLSDDGTYAIVHPWSYLARRAERKEQTGGPSEHRQDEARRIESTLCAGAGSTAANIRWRKCSR